MSQIKTVCLSEQASGVAGAHSNGAAKTHADGNLVECGSFESQNGRRSTRLADMEQNERPMCMLVR